MSLLLQSPRSLAISIVFKWFFKEKRKLLKMYAASYETGQVELFEMHCFAMFMTSLCDIFL